LVKNIYILNILCDLTWNIEEVIETEKQLQNTQYTNLYIFIFSNNARYLSHMLGISVSVHCLN